MALGNISPFNMKLDIFCRNLESNLIAGNDALDGPNTSSEYDTVCDEPNPSPGYDSVYEQRWFGTPRYEFEYFAVLVSCVFLEPVFRTGFGSVRPAVRGIEFASGKQKFPSVGFLLLR